MPFFRATVWYLNDTAACVEGNAAITRHIVQREAENEDMFKADVMDSWSRSVDDDISFGPVSRKEHA